MVFKKSPFYNKQNEIYMIDRIILQNLRPEISKDFTIKYPKIVELLNKCWLSNAEERPFMAEVVRKLEEIQIEPNLPSLLSINSQIIKKKIAEMNVEEICECLLTLELKEDYSSIIREENIQGKSLICFEEDEWKETFPKRGDR